MRILVSIWFFLLIILFGFLSKLLKGQKQGSQQRAPQPVARPIPLDPSADWRENTTPVYLGKPDPVMNDQTWLDSSMDKNNDLEEDTVRQSAEINEVEGGIEVYGKGSATSASMRDGANRTNDRGRHLSSGDSAVVAPSDAMQGMIWSQIFAAPRSKSPHSTMRTFKK